MKIEIYGEICCDLCYEIIHNHMDCPACGKKYAGTEQYGDLNEMYREDGRTEIECEKCHAKFETFDDPYWDAEWTLIYVETQTMITWNQFKDIVEEFLQNNNLSGNIEIVDIDLWHDDNIKCYMDNKGRLEVETA